jgi:hypothetical protein
MGINFDYKTNLFLATLAIYLLIVTLFSVNGSSVGVWNDVFHQKADSQILLGKPKPIRMDEWSLHTPAILSQCNSPKPFPVENYSLGAYKTPLIMNLPVAHFSTFLRPQYWLFFGVGIEKAYAFYWGMKLVLLVGGIFMLLMILLENNFFLSVFGALWVYFSSYMQWWYSSPAMLPELVGYFALLTSAFIIGLTSKRKTLIIAASLVFLVSFFNFVVSLYPPYQVPLVYLSLCIVVGAIMPNWRYLLSESIKNRFGVLCICISFLATAGLLLAWYLDVRQTLDVMSNTLYPGTRRTLGGGISAEQIFSGFVGIFIHDSNFPKIWKNVCESSNFILLFPIPLMLMCWRWFVQKKTSPLDASLAIFILIILFWQIAGFPRPVAQISLLDRVSENRALMPLGIASIIWTCYSLHQLMRDEISLNWRVRATIPAMMLIGVLLFSIYLNAVTGQFLSTYQIAIVCVFTFLVSLLWVSKQSLLFALFILLPNIYFNGLINPICVGLKPVLHNPLYEKVHYMVNQEPASKWVVFDKEYPFTANFLYSTGANIYNGVKYVPHLEEMKKLSSKNNDVRIYNRFGAISLSPVEMSEIKFYLSAKDWYVISVDPRNDCWKKLGITRGLLKTMNGFYFLQY